MRLMAPTALVTALVLGPLAVAADQESEKFHGTWTIVSTQRDGKKVEVPDASTVIFEKDSYRIKEGDKVV